MPDVGKRVTRLYEYLKNHAGDRVEFPAEDRSPAPGPSASASASAEGEGLTVEGGPVPAVSHESTSSSHQQTVEHVVRSRPAAAQQQAVVSPEQHAVGNRLFAHVAMTPMPMIFNPVMPTAEHVDPSVKNYVNKLAEEMKAEMTATLNQTVLDALNSQGEKHKQEIEELKQLHAEQIKQYVEQIEQLKRQVQQEVEEQVRNEVQRQVQQLVQREVQGQVEQDEQEVQQVIQGQAEQVQVEQEAQQEVQQVVQQEVGQEVQQRIQQLVQQQVEQEVQQQLIQRQPPSQRPSIHQPLRDWSAMACTKLKIKLDTARAPNCKEQSKGTFQCYSGECNHQFEKKSLNAYLLHLKRKHGIDLRDKRRSCNEMKKYLPRQEDESPREDSSEDNREDSSQDSSLDSS